MGATAKQVPPLRFDIPASVREYIESQPGSITAWCRDAIAAGLRKPGKIVGVPLTGPSTTVSVRLDAEIIEEIDAARASVGPAGDETCSRSSWASAAVCAHALGFKSSYSKSAAARGLSSVRGRVKTAKILG